MKRRNLYIIGSIILVSAFLIQFGFEAHAISNSPDAFYIEELYGLRKDGNCNSSTYSLLNLGWNYAYTSHSYFEEGSENSITTYVDPVSIQPGGTRQYDLTLIPGIPEGFTGYVIVSSTEPITGTILPFPPCEISLSGPNSGLTNISYTFTANVTPNDAEIPITYTWNATNLSSLTNPNGISDSEEFSWLTSGLKEIVVTAENTLGIATQSFPIHIYEPSRANFSVNNRQGFLPLHISFSNLSTGDFITSSWDFGDGSTSTLSNPTHIYTQVGNFTVSLTVDGPGGEDTETKVAYLSVVEGENVFLPVILNDR